jgi:hypothetical protein
MVDDTLADLKIKYITSTSLCGEPLDVCTAASLSE